MYFSISAPQNVTLPDGTTLSFRVNPVDSSLCEIHMVGVDGSDVAGTHILTFGRNGGPKDTAFVANPKPVEPVVAAPIPPVPKPASYPSVDKDAVRADDWKQPVNTGYVAPKSSP